MSVFKVAHINARSLLAGFNEIRDYIIENNYDIFMITETWLGEHIDNEVVNIAGYNLVREDRSWRGGGVGMYLKTSINFNIVQVSHYEPLEQMWLKITLNNKVYAFGVFYHPPNTNKNDMFEIFEDAVTNILPYCDDLICAGDINLNFLDLDNSYINKFLSILDTYGLSQLINEPTRITANKMSLLDIIVCSNASDISSYRVVYDTNIISDHELIECSVSFNKPNNINKMKTFRDFKNFDNNKFQQDLQLIPFHEILHIDDINNKVSHFTYLIKSLFDIHAPLRTIRITKHEAPWMTENIKLLRKLKNRALVRYKRSGNLIHFNYYKHLKNYLTTAIRNEKKGYLNHRITVNKSKYLWKDLDTLNIHSKKVNRDIPSQISDVNNINNYFINAVPSSSNVNVQDTVEFYSNNLKVGIGTKFSFKLLSMREVSDIINSITSNASGSDEININMIKYCCPLIIPYITHIINVCLLNNVFPENWKLSHVLPLPKINNPKDFKDLRPIHIISSLSKILEKAIYLQINNYISEHNLLPDHQSGFRSNFSCTTALMLICDDIINAVDRDELTALILLDYSKAFDCINHKILLAILHFLGFSRDTVEFFKNYLSSRKQIVKLNNNRSSEGILDCGVPQGSILGPLLFSLYTVNLHACLDHCKVHCYADDTQLYLSFKPSDLIIANAHINSDIDKLIKNSVNHCLKINSSKSAILLLGKSAQRAQYQAALDIIVDGTHLNIVNEAKNLGLYIDSDLRFKKHIDICIRKAYGNLRKIYSSKNLLNKSTLKLLCNAIVLSQFNYCDTIYGPCLDVLTAKRIQKVQNSCVRLICGIRRREHISRWIKDIGWLNMSNRRLLAASVLYHKILLNKCPPYLHNKIRFRTDIHNLNIRRKSLITPPIHKTKFFERSFSFNIYKTYNALPADMKKIKNFKVFKYKLRKHILGLQ